MAAYIARRLAAALPVILGVTVLVFIIMRVLPGDVAELMFQTETVVPEYLAEIRKEFGLDRPLAVQYAQWAAGMLRGDFGRSLRTGRPVAQEILARLPLTIELALISLGLSLIVALPLGALSGTRHHTAVDRIIRVGSLMGLSLPNFWVGTLLLLILGLYFRWVPAAVLVPFTKAPLSHLMTLLLPAVSLALAMAAMTIRMLRATMMDTLSRPFIRTAHSKGLARSTVVWRHAFRNALIPVITLTGLQVGYLLGGSIVIESVFGLPGLGRLIVNAITQRDYPIVQGVTVVVALSFVMINLVVDVLYAYADPSVRY